MKLVIVHMNIQMLSCLKPKQPSNGRCVIVIKEDVKFNEEQHVDTEEVQLTSLCINSI